MNRSKFLEKHTVGGITIRESEGTWAWTIACWADLHEDLRIAREKTGTSDTAEASNEAIPLEADPEFSKLMEECARAMIVLANQVREGLDETEKARLDNFLLGELYDHGLTIRGSFDEHQTQLLRMLAQRFGAMVSFEEGSCVLTNKVWSPWVSFIKQWVLVRHGGRRAPAATVQVAPEPAAIETPSAVAASAESAGDVETNQTVDRVAILLEALGTARISEVQFATKLAEIERDIQALQSLRDALKQARSMPKQEKRRGQSSEPRQEEVTGNIGKKKKGKMKFERNEAERAKRRAERSARWGREERQTASHGGSTAAIRSVAYGTLDLPGILEASGLRGSAVRVANGVVRWTSELDDAVAEVISALEAEIAARETAEKQYVASHEQDKNELREKTTPAAWLDAARQLGAMQADRRITCTDQDTALALHLSLYEAGVRSIEVQGNCIVQQAGFEDKKAGGADAARFVRYVSEQSGVRLDICIERWWGWNLEEMIGESYEPHDLGETFRAEAGRRVVEQIKRWQKVDPRETLIISWADWFDTTEERAAFGLSASPADGDWKQKVQAAMHDLILYHFKRIPGSDTLTMGLGADEISLYHHQMQSRRDDVKKAFQEAFPIQFPERGPWDAPRTLDNLARAVVQILKEDLRSKSSVSLLSFVTLNSLFSPRDIRGFTRESYPQMVEAALQAHQIGGCSVSVRADRQVYIEYRDLAALAESLYPDELERNKFLTVRAEQQYYKFVEDAYENSDRLAILSALAVTIEAGHIETFRNEAWWEKPPQGAAWHELLDHIAFRDPDTGRLRTGIHDQQFAYSAEQARLLSQIDLQFGSFDLRRIRSAIGGTQRTTWEKPLSIVFSLEAQSAPEDLLVKRMLLEFPTYTNNQDGFQISISGSGDSRSLIIEWDPDTDSSDQSGSDQPQKQVITGLEWILSHSGGRSSITLNSDSPEARMLRTLLEDELREMGIQITEMQAGEETLLSLSMLGAETKFTAAGGQHIAQLLRNAFPDSRVTEFEAPDDPDTAGSIMKALKAGQSRSVEFDESTSAWALLKSMAEKIRQQTVFEVIEDDDGVTLALKSDAEATADAVAALDQVLREGAERPAASQVERGEQDPWADPIAWILTTLRDDVDSDNPDQGEWTFAAGSPEASLLAQLEKSIDAGPDYLVIVHEDNSVTLSFCSDDFEFEDSIAELEQLLKSGARSLPESPADER